MNMLLNEKIKAAVKVKTPNNKPQKDKGGRPQKVISKEMRVAAIQYVSDSGISMEDLANFLGTARSTLQEIFKRDKEFSADIMAANAEFRRKTIKKAKPEFILRNKFRDEFPDAPKIETGDGTNERLKEFLDRATILTNARRRSFEADSTQE